MSLGALQTRLARALGERGTNGEAALAALADLEPLPRAPAEETLSLYQGAVETALRAALREIFPVCAALVGDDCFRAIVRAYARVHASDHPDLGRCGDALPDFLPQLAFLDGVAYLPDVAALELACHAAYRAPAGRSAIEPEAARAIGDGVAAAPEAWRLRLLPSVRLLRSRFPIFAIWKAHRPDAGEGALESVDLSAGGDRLIVWRSGHDVCIEGLGEGAWELLDAIAQGHSVAACLQLDVPVVELLSHLFSRGWIAGTEPAARGRADLRDRSSDEPSNQDRRSTRP